MTMKIHTRTIASAALTVFSAAIAGCSGLETELGEPANSAGFSEQLQSVLDDPPDLLARVALAPDQAFEIYGVGTNFIFSETGLHGSKLSPLTEADKDLGPAELYAKLAPGLPLPRRLSAYLSDLALGRTPVLAERRPEQAVVKKQAALFEDFSTSGFGPNGNSCPFSWFFEQRSFYGDFCPLNVGAFDKWCSGDRTWAFADYTDLMLWESTATVCVSSGTSPFIITTASGTRTFNQTAGSWRQVRVAECRGSFGCGARPRFGVKYDIRPGGVFQFGGYFKNQ
jgi:hypothetical protein